MDHQPTNPSTPTQRDLRARLIPLVILLVIGAALYGVIGSSVIFFLIGVPVFWLIGYFVNGHSGGAGAVLILIGLAVFLVIGYVFGFGHVSNGVGCSRATPGGC